MRLKAGFKLYYLIYLIVISLFLGTEGFSRWALRHSRHVHIAPISASMDMSLVYIPLQNDTSKYEDLLSSISGIPRDQILRWYIAKVEDDKAVLEVVHTADKSKANPQQNHQEKKRVVSKTPFPNSDYNTVPDVYAKYGRQPKPTTVKAKDPDEELVSDNISTESINGEGNSKEKQKRDAITDDKMGPVDIDIDPFAYIL